MKVKRVVNKTTGIKVSLEKDNKEIARAYLYILKNSLHQEPFGFIEDVYIEEKFRNQGLGTKLIGKIIEKAKENKCYKIIANSRHSNLGAHKLYERHGFKNHGIEFRLNLEK